MPKHKKEKKAILLNKLENVYSLLMKFGQFMSYYQSKKIYQKILQNLRPEN